MDKEKLKELVEKMGDYLDEVGDFGINMERAYLRIPDKNKPYKSCGCHAGFISAVFGASKDTEWVEGTDLLGTFLGFRDSCELTKWAQENPEIWGNEKGNDMFYTGCAFGLDFKIFSAKRILNHWEGVLERLQAI